MAQTAREVARNPGALAECGDWDSARNETMELLNEMHAR